MTLIELTVSLAQLIMEDPSNAGLEVITDDGIASMSVDCVTVCMKEDDPSECAVVLDIK